MTSTHSIPLMRKKEADVKTSYGGYDAGPIPTAMPHEMVFHDPFDGEMRVSSSHRGDVQPSHSVTCGDLGTSSSQRKRQQRKKALEGVSRDLLALALQRRVAD
jgi:hypothetical protein